VLRVRPSHGVRRASEAMITARSSAMGEQMLRRSLAAVESFYAISQGVEPLEGADWSLDDLPAKSALTAVAGRVDPEASRVLAEALGEILFECRAALEYADLGAPANRLACRVLEAMMPLVQEAGSNRLDGLTHEEPHAP
jgi:hypothetical protein